MKLQRNALSVIEAPTGNEEDDDLEFDNVPWNISDMGESSVHWLLVIDLPYFKLVSCHQYF